MVLPVKLPVFNQLKHFSWKKYYNVTVIALITVTKIFLPGLDWNQDKCLVLLCG